MTIQAIATQQHTINGRDRPVPFGPQPDFRSGEIWNMKVKVGSLPRAGEYELQVVYYAKKKKLLSSAKEDIRTNKIRFRIE